MLKPRGIISFVFDDGYSEIMSEALPLFEKYGFRATVAVPVNAKKVVVPPNTSVLSLDTWKDYCAKKGHELAAHGLSHVPLPSLSDEQIQKELKESKEKTNATTLIYPGGAFDKRVKEISSQYFSAARTTKRGWENLPPKDFFALNTFNASRNNFSVLKWNLWALKAYWGNKWLIETYHHVNQANELHSVQLHSLESHLRFIRHLPVRFATIAEVASTYQTK
ncbi:MAG: polysaccharide deacetylase family protein [bacterium]|nr:polysaccharide deacetylase family protein [bacterium]